MDDEFNEGMDAFNDGQDETDNPYADGTPDFVEWREGFIRAEQDRDDELEEEEGD